MSEVLKDINKALSIELNWLCQLVTPANYGPTRQSLKALLLSTDQALKMLRIEVSYETWANIRGDRESVLFLPNPQAKVPPSFRGVTIYEVGYEYQLPPCGWRIINPMRKESL